VLYAHTTATWLTSADGIRLDALLPIRCKTLKNGGRLYVTMHNKTRRITQCYVWCKVLRLNLVRFVTIIPDRFDQTKCMNLGMLLWLCVIQNRLECVLTNVMTLPAYANLWDLLFWILVINVHDTRLFLQISLFLKHFGIANYAYGILCVCPSVCSYIGL